MDFSTEIVSFMDLLDLDEELIDLRAKHIMERSSFTSEHLRHFTNLLMYKQLINSREESECCNHEEFSFLGKLLNNANEENVELICKIIKVVLKLNPSSIIDKSEHLLQQIVYDINLPAQTKTITDILSEETNIISLLRLKICGSILDAVLECGFKLSLPFLETPLEHLVCSKNEKLQIYFLMNTVTQFFHVVTGYNILDRIWNFIRQFKCTIEIILKVLCCLSNYYLPINEGSKQTELKSDVIFHSEFWNFVLLGLSSDNVSLRKEAVYLSKRAVDCAFNNNKNINVNSSSSFHWDNKNKISLKKMWDNYFILLDSLEEKQSNIVMPSLKLFDTASDIGHCWLICAYNIGLSHDNAQVKLKCLLYRLNIKVADEKEALPILEAINNINLFENKNDYDVLKQKLQNSFVNINTFFNIFKAIPLVKWSPVPLFHVSDVIANVKINKITNEIDEIQIVNYIANILKIPCNNKVIRKAFHVNISHFVGNCCKGLPWKEYLSIYSRINLNSDCNNPFIKYIKNDLIVTDKKQLLQLAINSHENMDFAILYFEAHNDPGLIEHVNEIILKIQDINSRMYSNKSQCLEDVIFLVHLYKKAIKNEEKYFANINLYTAKVSQIVLQYAMVLLSSNFVIDIENLNILFDGLDVLNTEIKLITNDHIVQCYKNCLLLLKDNVTDFNKKLLAIFILNTCLKSPAISAYNEQECLDVDNFIKIMDNIKFNNDLNRENSGRLRNAFFEKSCEITYYLITMKPYTVNDNILNYISNTLISGGYGCLKWILRIFDKIIVQLLESKTIIFNWPQFLYAIRKEIEDLKTNSQYLICLEEFIRVIIKDELLKWPSYKDIITRYCNKFIEDASMKSTPVYYLVRQMSDLKSYKYDHLMFLLSEILLYPGIQRKDQR